jgi:hypothetical protein
MNTNGDVYVDLSANLGTAGSANAKVLSVQGIGSMTPFLVNPGTATLWNASWAGGTLGAMANYGTSPGAVLVPGVNAFITNTGTNASPSSSYLSITGGLAAGSTSSGQTGSVVMGFASTNAPTATNADSWPLSISPASGGVRIDLKDTAANTNNFNVINGANFYQAEPASTTITALTGGGGGATGDYLSHCTVIPTTVSPGVFTITDNATAIYSFPGGASSLSNLVPWTIPIGAKSVSGAWKVTTGAGLSIVCVGKFT